MTTDTEALRAQFEETIEAIFGNRPYVLDCRHDGGAYAAKDIQMAWHAYQAGHAVAKAETADAVAAERERAAMVCEKLAAKSPWDYDRFTRAAACRDCAHAIRAGAKEPGDEA